jgi:hypothetical protein
MPFGELFPQQRQPQMQAGRGLGAAMQPTQPMQQMQPRQPTQPGNAPPAFGPEVQQLSQFQNLMSQLQNPQQRMTLAQTLAQHFQPPPAQMQGFGRVPLPGQQPPLGESGGFPVSPQSMGQPNMGNPMSNILQYLASQGKGY